MFARRSSGVGGVWLRGQIKKMVELVRLKVQPPVGETMEACSYHALLIWLTKFALLPPIFIGVNTILSLPCKYSEQIVRDILELFLQKICLSVKLRINNQVLTQFCNKRFALLLLTCIFYALVHFSTCCIRAYHKILGIGADGSGQTVQTLIRLLLKEQSD